MAGQAACWECSGKAAPAHTYPALPGTGSAGEELRQTPVPPSDRPTSLSKAPADSEPLRPSHPSHGAMPRPHRSRGETSQAQAQRTGVPQRARTCDAAPVGNSHRAEAVVRHGSNLPGAAGPMVVAVLLVRVRHRVGIVGVQVIAAFGALKTDPQSRLGALLSSLWEKQVLRACCAG